MARGRAAGGEGGKTTGPEGGRAEKVRDAGDRAAATVYSPSPMGGEEGKAGRAPLVARLEGKLAELERLAEALDGVPEGEVVGVLDEAVALLKEVNAGLETGLAGAEGEARELEGLLDGVDFGSFDAALAEAEDPPAGGRAKRG